MSTLFGTKESRLEIARWLVRAGAPGLSTAALIPFRGGTPSPFYMNCREVQGSPAIEASIGGAFASAARQFSPQIIAGIQNSAIPHSTIAAQVLVLPHASIRKEVKGHGVADLVEGAKVKGRRVVLIEDIISEAGSVIHGMEAVAAADGVVVGCIAVMSYDFKGANEKVAALGVPLVMLVELEDMLDAIKLEVMSWKEKPDAWHEQWLRDRQLS